MIAELALQKQPIDQKYAEIRQKVLDFLDPSSHDIQPTTLNKALAAYEKPSHPATNSASKVSASKVIATDSESGENASDYPLEKFFLKAKQH